MAAIATDGKGNYLTLSASGDWVPFEPPPAPEPVGVNPMGDEGGTGGSALPTRFPEVVKKASRSVLGLPDQLTQEQRNAVDAPTAAERVLQAAKEGWRDAPTLLPPGSGQQVTPGSGLGLNQPLVTLGNAVLGAGNAALRGGQAFAYETLAPYSKPLARDVAALPEAFPTGDAGLPGGPRSYTEARAGSTRGPLQIRASSPPPVTLNELAGAIDRVPPEMLAKQNQMMPGEPAPPSPSAPEQPPHAPPAATDTRLQSQPGPQPDAPQPPPPGEPTHIYQGPEYDNPVTPTGAEQTHSDGRVYAEVKPPDGPATWVPKEHLVARDAAQSEPAGATGAQITPASQSGLTPKQEAAAGSAADKQWYYKTIIPGEANTIQYIDGITPTMAMRELDVKTARESKLLRRISEEADQNERAELAKHSEIRKNEFGNIAGSDVTSLTAMEEANAQIEQQLQAAYAHGGTVDLEPVISATQRELSGSAGKLPPMKAAMKEIQDAAQKSDGTGLETDPRQANAVRRAIIFMQSKKGQLANPGYGDADVMAALTRVKDVLTKQVEPAAPGFTEANTNYAKARQALDAREALQAYEPKLYTGPTGNMTFGPMHRLMGDIIAGRDPRAPMNPYKHLTEDQMNRLKSLHDDLQRVATSQELANAAGGGSDTSSTLFDMAKRAARSGVSTLGGAAAGMLVGKIWPDAAVSAGMFTKGALDNLFSQRAVAKATREHNALLHPDPALYPTKPNPLMQPPGAP